MLNITPINYTNPQSNNIAFKGDFSRELLEVKNVMAPNSFLTMKSLKLLKRINILIDDTWIELKKKKINGVIPEFTHKKLNSTATLKPLYNSTKDTVMLQIETDKSIDKIIIERTTPNAFLYEHAVKTDFGSATTKTFNSKRSSSLEITTKVNDFIETYFPKFLQDAERKKKSYIK